ncbi:MAG TPA: glycosyltransferase family 39 protein [Candidatus Eisenbacteria bacterium]|nr:glycosyltransferase family 39 protein [Candidatus Eisenbacteria bacterium]
MTPRAVSAFPPARAVLAALLLVFAAQAGWLIRAKSPSTDEVPFHLCNGYVDLLTRDFRMSPVQPPLIREWMGLPWLLIRPKLDLEKDSWKNADSAPFCTEFFYKDNRAIADRLLYSARAMVLLLGLALAVAVYLWARTLYGERAALASVALFTFSPMMLAHSALGTVDVGAAVFFFLSVFLLHRHFLGGGDGFPWAASVALGLALAAKFTAVLLLPVFLILLVSELGIWRGLARYSGVVFVAFMVTWSAYFFEFKPLLAGVPRVEEKEGYIAAIADKFTGMDPAAREKLIYAAHHVPMPLASWALGLAGTVRERRTPNGHFFLGHWREAGTDHTGKWYFYLFGFLVKSTLGFLVLLAARKAALFLMPRRDDLYQVLPAVFVIAASCFDTSWRGSRYLMPAIPFLCVWAGGVFRIFTSRTVLVPCAAALAAHVAASAAQFPYPQQYFNALVGGPSQGWRYLRDSDLDWGQELKTFAAWARRHQVTRVKTYLFGSRDEDFYGIPHVDVEEAEYRAPRRELYAISTFYLSHFDWTAAATPTDTVGHAIFIYDFRGKGAS